MNWAVSLHGDKTNRPRAYRDNKLTKGPQLYDGNGLRHCVAEKSHSAKFPRGPLASTIQSIERHN